MSHPTPRALFCLGGGMALLLCALVRAGCLSQAASQPFVMGALVFLILFSSAVLFLCCRRWETILCALPPIALALLLRVLLLDHVTDDYTTFLSDWAAFFRENGGWAAVALPKGNYTAPYLYFLAAISYLPVFDLYLIKLFSIFFDVVLAWGSCRLVRVLAPETQGRSAAAFCLILLLPTVVLNGAAWSQCDAIYAALCLHGLAAGLEGRPRSSAFLAGLAFACKLQTVFLLPVWAVLWMSRRVRFRDLLCFPAACVLAVLPALLLGKPLGDTLGVYFGQAAEYSAYLTLNAPSLYALLPARTQVDVAAAARLGIAAAFLLVLGVLGWLLLRRRNLSRRAIFLSAVVFAIGIPLLLPHMHDRYFFLADVLTLTWACIHPRGLLPAFLTQLASLGAYHAYLLLRYAFPMGLGALLLLCALLLALAALVRDVQEGDGPQKFVRNF